MRKIIGLSILSLLVVTASPAHAAAISHMSISDVTGDSISGAFRFSAINFSTYAGTSCFNSDGAAISGCSSGAGGQIAGVGSDGGIIFGVAQDVGRITPGFAFAGAPFQPRTLGAPQGSIDWNPVSSRYQMTITALPWAGLYNNAALFPLGPDTAPAEACTAGEAQSGGICVRMLESIGNNQFRYAMRWSHLITADEDPSGGSFTGFNTRWALEGVATVVPLPAAAWMFSSGLLCFGGFIRHRGRQSRVSASA